MMGSEGEPRLPPGYRLDRSDPDVWALRRPEGWVVAYFSAQGVTNEAVEAGGVAGPRRRQRGRVPVKETHDYIHHYRGYWSAGASAI